jgi:predicted  nucleic acid-binding Zn-ribbon protein
MNNITEEIIKMTEEIKDVNAKIDAAEDAVKKYASKDTVISIGGYEFTPAKLMVAFTLVSSLLGGLYGCFEVYKDYQDMKVKITKYVAPDLSEYDKRLSIVEQNSQKELDYVNNIKNDLKADIRRNGDQVDQVERSAKQSERETQQDVQDVRKELKQLSKDVDSKIQKAMDNPLAK